MSTRNDEPAQAQTADGKAVDFAVVLHEELTYLEQRRRRMRQAEAAYVAATVSEEERKKDEKQQQERAVRGDDQHGTLYQDALDADLCGLTISGGGIRSATYGLGVIQGLAV